MINEKCTTIDDRDLFREMDNEELNQYFIDEYGMTYEEFKNHEPFINDITLKEMMIG